VWSTRFIDDFSPDIVTALGKWLAHRSQHVEPRSDVGRGRNNGAYAELRRYLDDHIARNKPLPGYRG
jgi:hypothetical protein